MLWCEGQHIIKFVLALIQKTISVHAAEERLAFKDPLLVFLIELEEFFGCIPDSAQSILHSPELSLASETIFTNEFQFLI